MREPISSAALYGSGIFTTIAVIDEAPFLWEKHWRRLTANAAKIEIDISEYSEAKVLEALTLEIEEKNLRSGRARITFSDESESEIWSHQCQKKTSLSIMSGERHRLPSEFSLTVSQHIINTTSPLVGIKSCNYLEHLLAHREAKKRGFDEAIRLNERGEIVSACMANIFWSKDGNLLTPRLKTGCLAGTMREFILENLECKEVEEGIEGLNRVDSIFLTSAGLGVTRIAEFEGKLLSSAEHEIRKLSPF